MGPVDRSLLAIVISHGHIDHWGLAPLVGGRVKLAMGAATQRILKAAAPFLPQGFAPHDVLELADRRLLQIGPFTITPYLVDHSAYDAYALVIEAEGRRLLYSGDIRGHGRKAKLFDAMLQRPPKNIDVMLMEGSSLGRLEPEAQFPTETEIEERFVEEFATAGFVVVSASAQNVDRIVTLYRACKRTGRTLVLDLCAMEIFARREATIYRTWDGPIWRYIFRNTNAARSAAPSVSTCCLAISRRGFTGTRSPKSVRRR